MYLYSARRGCSFTAKRGQPWRAWTEGPVFVREVGGRAQRRDFPDEAAAAQAWWEAREYKLGTGFREPSPFAEISNPKATRDLLRLLEGRRPPARVKVLKLLSAGADPDCRHTGKTVAALAALHRRWGVLEALADRGVDLDHAGAARPLAWRLQTPLSLLVLAEDMAAVGRMAELLPAPTWTLLNLIDHAQFGLRGVHGPKGFATLAAEVRRVYLPTIRLLVENLGEDPEGALAELERALLGPEDPIPALLAARGTPAWAQAARNLVAPRWKKPEQVDDLVSRVMFDSIEEPAWAEVVEALIAAQPSFEEVSEEVYGQRLNRLEDEGWLSDVWEEYDVTGQVARLLTQPAAIERPEWAALVTQLIERVDESQQTPRAELEALLETEAARGLPRYDDLLDFVRYLG